MASNNEGLQSDDNAVAGRQAVDDFWLALSSGADHDQLQNLAAIIPHRTVALATDDESFAMGEGTLFGPVASDTSSRVVNAWNDKTAVSLVVVDFDRCLAKFKHDHNGGDKDFRACYEEKCEQLSHQPTHIPTPTRLLPTEQDKDTVTLGIGVTLP